MIINKELFLESLTSTSQNGRFWPPPKTPITSPKRKTVIQREKKRKDHTTTLKIGRTCPLLYSTITML